MNEFGIVLGRFQPFHIGHEEFIKAARERCSRLCIGITNLNPTEQQGKPSDDRRLDLDNNPFCYYDRMMMIEASLVDWGWEIQDFMLTPAPIERHETMRAFLPPPREAVFLTTIYDAWGEKKSTLLKDLGYEVVELWRRSPKDRKTSGTEIRDLIRHGRSRDDGKSWEHLVPRPVAQYIKNRDIII